MSAYEQAMEIYDEIKDMDYMDYIETYEEDIEYTAGLIRRYGFNKALKICLSYFE